MTARSRPRRLLPPGRAARPVVAARWAAAAGVGACARGAAVEVAVTATPCGPVETAVLLTLQDEDGGPLPVTGVEGADQIALIDHDDPALASASADDLRGSPSAIRETRPVDRDVRTC